MKITDYRIGDSNVYDFKALRDDLRIEKLLTATSLEYTCDYSEYELTPEEIAYIEEDLAMSELEWTLAIIDSACNDNYLEEERELYYDVDRFNHEIDCLFQERGEDFDIEEYYYYTGTTRGELLGDKGFDED